MNTAQATKNTITDARHNGIIDASTANSLLTTAQLIDSILKSNPGKAYNLAAQYSAWINDCANNEERLTTLKEAQRVLARNGLIK